MEHINRNRLVEDYVKGTMSDEDKSAFEKRMALDHDLMEEVTMMQQLFSHFDEGQLGASKHKTHSESLIKFFRSDQAQQTKMALKNAQATYEKNKKQSLTRFIAASVIGILLCVSAYFSLNKQESLYDEYYVSSDLPSLVSRGETANVLSQIALTYQNEEYHEVIVLSEQYINTVHEVDANVYLYLGMAYLFVDNDEMALKNFNQMAMSDSIDQSKGYWFEALLYMKNDNNQALKDTLKKILSNSENFKYSKAKELYDSLN